MLLKYAIKVYKYAIKVYKYHLNERSFIRSEKNGKLVYTHGWILLIISSILAVVTLYI